MACPNRLAGDVRALALRRLPDARAASPRSEAPASGRES